MPHHDARVGPIGIDPVGSRALSALARRRATPPGRDTASGPLSPGRFAAEPATRSSLINRELSRLSGFQDIRSITWVESVRFKPTRRILHRLSTRPCRRCRVIAAATRKPSSPAAAPCFAVAWGVCYHPRRKKYGQDYCEERRERPPRSLSRAVPLAHGKRWPAACFQAPGGTSVHSVSHDGSFAAHLDSRG